MARAYKKTYLNSAMRNLAVMSRVPRYQNSRRMSGFCHSSVKTPHIGGGLVGGGCLFASFSAPERSAFFIVKYKADLLPALMKEVEDKIVVVRGQRTLLDRDVAALYGVETKRVNEAVKNNPRKYREGYVIELTKEESDALRSKISTIEVPNATLEALRSNNSTLEPVNGKGRHSKYNFKAFTSRGLYMLATCLKSDRAADATVAIVETFDKVQTLKQELLELHKETDKAKQTSKMKHFGEVLSDIVMPDLQTQETESTLEINFFIGKLKHTVKRVRKE